MRLRGEEEQERKWRRRVDGKKVENGKEDGNGRLSDAIDSLYPRSLAEATLPCGSAKRRRWL